MSADDPQDRSRPTLPTRASMAPRTSVLPTRSSTAAPAAAITGNLAERSAEQLFEGAKKAYFSGAVHVEDDRRRVSFYFEGGEPKGAVSDDPELEMGFMLHRAGRIDRRAYDVYQEKLPHVPAPAIALRDAGVSDRKTLAMHIAWHGRSLIDEVMKWKSGTYAVVRDEPMPLQVARVSLAPPAPTGAAAPGGSAPGKPGAPGAPAAAKPTTWRQGYLSEEEMQSLEANLAKYLVTTPEIDRAVKTLGLDDREREYVGYLKEKPMQMRHAFAISTLLRLMTRKIVFHLIRLGGIRLEDTNPEGYSEIPLEELDRYAQRLEVATHFDALVVHPSSTASEIDQRYRLRVIEFDPSRFQNAKPEHLETLKKIRQRIERAYGVLGDLEARRKYRAECYGPDQLACFLDLQLQKAQVAVRMRRDPKTAMPLLESALDLEPGSALAKVLMAEAHLQLDQRIEARNILHALYPIPSSVASDVARLKEYLGMAV